MEDLSKKLSDLISNHVNKYVQKPTLETVNKNIHAPRRLGAALVLLRHSCSLASKDGMDYDENHLRQLSKEEIEKYLKTMEQFIEYVPSKSAAKNDKHLEALKLMKNFSTNKHLMTYLEKEVNWIVISILSASYLSANILMRAVFELLIGIATKNTESMSKRIDSITFLSNTEKKKMKKIWNKLCSWGHPYSKWEREICPIYVSHEPLYHPKLCKESIEILEELIGFWLVSVIEKFKIDKTKLGALFKELSIDLTTIQFINKRI